MMMEFSEGAVVEASVVEGRLSDDPASAGSFDTFSSCGPGEIEGSTELGGIKDVGDSEGGTEGLRGIGGM